MYEVGYDGTEFFWTRVTPGIIRAGGTIANKMWLVKDLNGRNLAVFQTLEKTGRILIDETLNLITPGLSKISGDNQSGVPGAIIANSLVIEVRDENGSVLEGISVTFTVTAGNGTLSVTRATTDKNGAVQSTLTLGPNLGTNTVSVSASGIEGMVTFSAMVEAAVDLPDLNLRAAIETVLGKAKGDSITPSEMAALTRLEAPNANISDLTGLEFATNLTTLKLGPERVANKWRNSKRGHRPLTPCRLDPTDTAASSQQQHLKYIGGRELTPPDMAASKQQQYLRSLAPSSEYGIGEGRYSLCSGKPPELSIYSHTHPNSTEERS